MQNRLSTLAVVQQITPQGGRWRLQVEQRAAWAQSCEQGIVIALSITENPRSAHWLMQVTLLLAANPHSIDDALQYWQQQWWVWHRYPLDADRDLLEQGLLLQVALVTLLDQQQDEAQLATAAARPSQSLFSGSWG
ncbi:MAG: hypothetical protein AB2989_04910 [Candidatus Symbiodolus clandestinus]